MVCVGNWKVSVVGPDVMMVNKKFENIIKN